MPIPVQLLRGEREGHSSPNLLKDAPPGLNSRGLGDSTVQSWKDSSYLDEVHNRPDFQPVSLMTHAYEICLVKAVSSVSSCICLKVQSATSQRGCNETNDQADLHTA